MSNKLTSSERIIEENQKKANLKLKEVLERITNKTPEELRDDEINFLRARASYLSGDEKTKFASILKIDTPKKEEKK